MSDDEIYLTEHELAERWRMKPDSLRVARSRGSNLVPFWTIGRAVRYRLSDVRAAERLHPRGAA
jgi:hypothetical protein